MADNLDQWPNVSAEMTAIGNEFLAEYREILNERSLSQSDSIPDSMMPEVISDNEALYLAIQLVGHWYWAEYGRGPGKMPPRDAIRQWFDSTGQVPYPDENGNTPSVASAVYMIARKIGREGTKGKGIVADIVKHHKDEWTQRIQLAASQDIQIRLNQIFQKLTNI